MRFAEDAEDDGADNEPLDPLVEALFDEIERMRIQVSILLTSLSFSSPSLMLNRRPAHRSTRPRSAHRSRDARRSDERDAGADRGHGIGLREAA